ncbi:MAG TPA: hypothetical protein VHV55_20695 [Pirellulales bacterium]|jgi:DNA primase|nr:hypothetical protein [Pirellulales bacterium]
MKFNDPSLSAPMRAILAKLEDVREPIVSGESYRARCPAHADTNPSLSITQGEDGRVLMHCHAGCKNEEILKELDMEESELFMPGLSGRKPAERAQYRSTPVPSAQRTRKDVDLTEDAEQYRAAMIPDRRQKLAKELGVPAESLAELGVPAESLAALGVGWDNTAGCYVFPERNAVGKVIGIVRRFDGGRKSFQPGGQRGLYLPEGFKSRPGPILVVEGASDTATAHAMGLAVVGRPNATGGVEELATLLEKDKRKVIVVGEWDMKEGGRWPGRDAAKKVAKELSKRLGREIKWALPPKGAKDVREWFSQQGTSDGD